MGIFTNHKLALVAGFVLAAVIMGIGLSAGNVGTAELVGGLARWATFWLASPGSACCTT